jgi:integrase/recombinase XerD
MAAADFIPWSDAMKIVDMLKKDNTFQSTQYLAFVLLGLYSGLRIGDILKLKYSDLKEDNIVTEEKTGKKRNITFDKEVLQIIKKCKEDLMKDGDDLIVPFSSAWTSTVLKTLTRRAGIWNKNISNHSLRKAFARRIWEKNGKDESSLVLLSQVLGHSNIATTRIYLGITSEEIRGAYMSLY